MKTYRWSLLSVRHPKLHSRTTSTQVRRKYDLCYAQDAVTGDAYTVC